MIDTTQLAQPQEDSGTTQPIQYTAPADGATTSTNPASWFDWAQQNLTGIPGTYTGPGGGTTPPPPGTTTPPPPYPSFGTTTPQTGLQMPSPWIQGMAGTQQAMQTGLPTQMPNIWGNLGGLATQMATTGAPTSQDPWYQQAKQVAGRDIASSIGQAAEQAGLKGMRWSSPLARQAQEIAARRMGEVGLEWTGRELGALEAARGRQLQAMPLMQQVGAGQAGLSEAARQRQFGALPLQLQFGQAVGQYPMDVAQRAMQMGGTMQQQQMAAMAPLYQEFLRQTPEASPWLQMAMGATQMPFTQGPQQYQQSGMSNMLGIASILPFLLSSAQFKKDISEVTNEDEEKIFEQMKDTPIFKYRYKFEDDETTPHLGLITEESPDELTLFDNKAVGLYEYVSTLHAMIKVLSRKIEKLED
ncbi:MAG: hypothetical protein V3V81_08045 [Candidatus Bathyarchaeia archaeon]